MGGNLDDGIYSFGVAVHLHLYQINGALIMTKYNGCAILSAGTVKRILAEGDMKPLSKQAVSDKLARKIESGENVSRLTAIRLTRGMTQNQLAEITGFKQAYISRLENGSASAEKMSMANGYILSKALKCKMEDLIDKDKILGA